MVITERLAQQIVDRTMEIIGKNINVMNEQGIIIGSGDKDRLGTQHDGAVQVIKRQRGVTITEEEAGEMKGAKPGINLPILFQNQIVGVVGITGLPSEVESYGELVKMAAEVTLQQAFLTEQLQWDERLREEMVSQLIHSEIDDLFMERAERLNIDLTAMRVPVIIEIIPNHFEEDRLADVKRQVSSLLKNVLPAVDLIASISSTQFVVLKKVSKKVGGWDKTFTKQQLSQLYNHLKRLEGISIRISVGTPFSDVSDVEASFDRARKTLLVGKELQEQAAIYFYDDYLIAVLFSEVCHLDGGITDPYEAMVQHDKKGELEATFEAFVELDGELNEVADRLFIHRNTLRYRLGRIEALTGKDPRKIKDLLDLYISRLMYQLHKK